MRYSVKTLTPLLVGDGRELSPIDYMVWKDQVNVLDQTRIFKLLARGPRLEGYLGQLRKATKLDFASWGGFAQNFSQRRIPFESAEAGAAWDTAPSEALFIPTFASGTAGAYLPASAIKGALRTGLLFSRWSGSTIERAASAMDENRFGRRISESAEITAGASQMRIAGFGDSDPVGPASFKVYLSRTASLDTRDASRPRLAWKIAGRGSVLAQKPNESTPVFAEMAVPGTVFSGEWREHTFLENPDLTRALGWRSVPTPETIVEAVNDCAAAQLDLAAKYAEATELDGLGQSVASLKRELEAARSAPLSGLFCLGWGAGFLSKVANYETDSAAYRKILRAIPSLSRSIRDNVPYPKTRRVLFAGARPHWIPGWVQFQLKK